MIDTPWYPHILILDSPICNLIEYTRYVESTLCLVYGENNIL